MTLAISIELGPEMETLLKGMQREAAVKLMEAAPRGFVTVPVDSTMISTLRYLPGEDILRVVFNSGDEYEYQGVAPREFAELADAESVGQHFNARIRDRYTAMRLEEV
jgi:hypothetical protein